MGLAGSVACNCWKEGKASCPPSSVPTEFLELESDGVLILALPRNRPDDETLATLIEFDRWHADACPHDLMDFAYERLGSYGVTISLKEEIARVGPARFPLLGELLPEMDRHEPTLPETARRVLQEVEDLQHCVTDEFMVDVLRQMKVLFLAAIETGNPVSWS